MNFICDENLMRSEDLCMKQL